MNGRYFNSLAAATICCMTASITLAENQGGSDFTFRRIAVPQPGAPRNLVQIAPGDQEDYLNGVEGSPEISGDDLPVVPTDLPFAWFWEQISPDINQSGPGRLEAAVNHLSNPPVGQSINAPRLQTLQNIAAQHRSEILSATIGTGVSPAFVLAVIGVESAGRTDAVSSAGATGLMQLMPATAERFGVEDSTDATQNIRGGTAYLDWLLKEFNGDPVLALAGYNAGENAVKGNQGVPPYAETRAYVPKVLAAWSIARGLCVTPPELVSDGCVFAVERLASDG